MHMFVNFCSDLFFNKFVIFKKNGIIVFRKLGIRFVFNFRRVFVFEI
jgi:hypothetical protein